MPTKKKKSWIDPGKMIERAATLIADGYPQGEVEPGVWLCWSQTHGPSVIYTVTADSCSCWIGEHKRSLICKHRWACFAVAIVEFIQQIRKAESKEVLEDLAVWYEEPMTEVLRCYVDYAREEYRTRLDQLKEAA